MASYTCTLCDHTGECEEGARSIRCGNCRQTIYLFPNPAYAAATESRSMFQLRPNRKPLVIVLTGPSGTGKDTVLGILQDKLKIPFHMAVTTTTRDQRAHEVNGKDYHFVSAEKFLEMIAKGQLIEWALVYDQYKGCSRLEIDEALARGEDVLLRIDVQGAAVMRKLYPDAVLIFITPENECELEKRIAARGGGDPEEIALRLKTARQEYAQMEQFDYVVINPTGHPELAARDMATIINAEHMRSARVLLEN